jgi:hypothetical protein
MAEPQVAPGWEGVGNTPTTPIVKRKSLKDSFKGFKVLVHGPTESLKTGSGLMFPDPDVLDLEFGTVELADMYANRNIGLYECIVMDEVLIDGKMQLDIDKVKSLYEFGRCFGEAISNPSKTIIVDNISELYDWAMEFMKLEGKGLTKGQVMKSTYKKLMERKDVSSFDFGISNGIIHDTIMKGLTINKHFYVVARDDEIWEDNKPSGKFKMAVQKSIPGWMPIHVRMGVEKSHDGKHKTYSATIEKFRGTNVTGETQVIMKVDATGKLSAAGAPLYEVKQIKTLYAWLMEIKERNKATVV